MATTQQKAAPQKKSEGFTGVRGAFYLQRWCRRSCYPHIVVDRSRNVYRALVGS